MFMIYPYTGTIRDSDLIALVKDNEFIGYCKAIAVMDSSVLLNIDDRAGKILKRLEDQGIFFTLELQF